MRKGILLDDNDDLAVHNGTLVIGESDKQNIDLITESCKGEFKEYPVLGCGLVNYLKTTGQEKDMIREVTVQLALDGYNATVTYNNDNLEINY